jgi:ureidoglycolate dehydrogenase (NAD+)
MIEILSSLLVANPIISASLNGAEEAPFNGLVMAIDPRAFGDNAAFIQAIDELSRPVKGLHAASENGEVLLPGERGFVELNKRTRGGIPPAIGTLSRLVELATRRPVPVPESLR